MNPSATLKSLRAYVLEHGWTQGTLEQDDGSVCAMGGLSKVILSPIFGARLLGAAQYLLQARTEEKRQLVIAELNARGLIHTAGNTGITGYNDYGLKTIDEFVEWVDAAIALAEAEEVPEETRELVTA